MDKGGKTGGGENALHSLHRRIAGLPSVFQAHENLVNTEFYRLIHRKRGTVYFFIVYINLKYRNKTVNPRSAGQVRRNSFRQSAKRGIEQRLGTAHRAAAADIRAGKSDRLIRQRTTRPRRRGPVSITLRGGSLPGERDRPRRASAIRPAPACQAGRSRRCGCGAGGPRGCRRRRPCASPGDTCLR